MYYIFIVYGSNILKVLSQVKLDYLPFILIISIIQYLLSAWRWHFIARKTESKIYYKDAIKFYYISGFLNNVLPTGILGDVYRTLNIKINNEKKNIFKAIQSVVLERLSGQLALFISFILSLFLFFIINEKYEASLYVIGVIILLYLILYQLILYKKDNKYVINFKYIFSGRRLLKHILMSLIIVLTYISTYIICALSLNLDIDILSFFVFAPIVLFSMALPISIGGWGIREITALLISFLLGLSVASSVTVAIVYGILNFICSLPGAFFLLKTRTT